MTTRTEEREQFLADIITTAVEGGTGHWAAVARYKWENIPTAEVHAVLIDSDDDEGRAKRRAAREAKGADAKLTADEALAIEGGATYLLDIEAVARGIGKITRGEVKIGDHLKSLIAEASRENEAGDIDADAADCIAQVALLGEITYG